MNNNFGNIKKLNFFNSINKFKIKNKRGNLKSKAVKNINFINVYFNIYNILNINIYKNNSINIYFNIYNIL